MQEIQETRIWCLDQEDLLEKEMTTQSSILAWKIPWTEEPGRLYSPWGHKEVDTTENTHTHTHTHTHTSKSLGVWKLIELTGSVSPQDIFSHSLRKWAESPFLSLRNCGKMNLISQFVLNIKCNFLYTTDIPFSGLSDLIYCSSWRKVTKKYEATYATKI